MFDVFYSGPKPNRFAFERPADSLEHAASLSRTRYYWYIYGGNDYSNFDFTYEPAPWESDFVHVWPTPWHQYGGAYLAHKDTAANQQWHFHKQVVNIKADPLLFETLHPCETFDYTWRPHPLDPPYTYVFGNQWHMAERMPTVTYTVPGATERKYMHEPQAQLPEVKANWQVTADVPFEFDFSWVPDPHNPPYIYVFGNQHWTGERAPTVEYHVPGATERKFVQDVQAELGVLDIFYMDMGNPTAQVRYDRLIEKYSATKIRYANSIMDTISRCATRARTARFWVVSSEYDFVDFDFAWQPEPWQHGMTHVFPSQHNKWSNTFLVNKWEFERHIKWAKSLEEFPNLNFVTNQSVTKTENLHNIYYVDHANPESRTQYELLKKFEPDIILTRFANTYLDTMKRIVSTSDTEYVWILNSICNYDFFDFTWQPEPWQREMIQCFANSNGIAERRGDTFYIHVESFRKQMVELELLDWFNVINYNTFPFVQRWPTPVVHYETDNLIAAVQAHTFETPYVLFTNQPHMIDTPGNSNCIWSDKDRVVIPYTHSKAVSAIPREIKRYLKTQIYDYPYLEKENSQDFFAEQPLDIVYISNGEPDEQRYYNNLEDDVYGNPLRDPRHRIKWVRGVDGRVAAYQEAARQSSTAWFFAVFAKLEVDGVDWTWQPDYWQQPKHYIFNARNPVNGLEYGHMGMIAYNKRLVLENNSPGIDFTLSQPHESVPILSGTAHFNQDAWTTWRTAFREVLKLRLFMATQPTVETEHRLNTWLSTAQGNYSDYCLAGARDAVAYYESVAGDAAQLQLSFDWRWLRDKYDAKY
jgi:hypothetical protein